MQRRACLKAPTKLPRLLADRRGSFRFKLRLVLEDRVDQSLRRASTSVALSARAEAAKTHLITVGETTFGKVLDTRVLCIPFHDWRAGVS